MGRKVIAVSTYNAVVSPHTLAEGDSAPDGRGTGMDVTSGKLISHRVFDGLSLSPVTGPQSSNIFTLCGCFEQISRLHDEGRAPDCWSAAFSSGLQDGLSVRYTLKPWGYGQLFDTATRSHLQSPSWKKAHLNKQTNHKNVSKF